MSTCDVAYRNGCQVNVHGSLFTKRHGSGGSSTSLIRLYSEQRKI
jgi:hypothetical protein